MSHVVVGVADGKVSRDSDTTLVTYALGSCIALALHDPVSQVGGLLHFMLPTSSLDASKAQKNPYMFADTGIPALLSEVLAQRADRRRLVVKAVGGAQVMDPNGVFNIGKRNYLEMRKVLWKAGLMVQAEEVGGTVSRTVRLEVGSGRLWIREGGGRELELAGPHRPASVGQGGSNGVPAANRR